MAGILGTPICGISTAWGNRFQEWLDKAAKGTDTPRLMKNTAATLVLILM